VIKVGRVTQLRKRHNFTVEHGPTTEEGGAPTPQILGTPNIRQPGTKLDVVTTLAQG